MFASIEPPVFARYPTIAPTNESPAPVGSSTFSSGNAGATNSPFFEDRIAPCSPFFTITYRGPNLCSLGRADTTLSSPVNCLASLSLSTSMSTRLRRLRRSFIATFIHRSIVSATMNFGLSSWSMIASCAPGGLLASRTYFALRCAAGSTGE